MHYPKLLLQEFTPQEFLEGLEGHDQKWSRDPIGCMVGMAECAERSNKNCGGWMARILICNQSTKHMLLTASKNLRGLG